MRRLIDIFFSFIAIIILFPLLLLTMLILRCSGEGEIFYVQKRIGYKGVQFGVLKFATMLKNSPNIGAGEITLKEDPRVLPIGRFLRKSKLNELPQLWNIFIGDMSLVGPRPCLPELAEKFDANGKKRNNVKPGLTGLAQVNGNIFLSWQKRWEYDAYYVENKSLLLDFKILYLTLKVLIKGENRF